MVIVSMLFMMMFVGADVGAAVFDQPEKEEVIVTLYAGEYQITCCGKWDVTDMKSLRGLSFQEELISAGKTLKQTGAGESDFLEYFMRTLKESGGLGERFRDVGDGAPLSKGVATIDDGLVWGASFWINNAFRDDDRYSEVVCLSMPGKSVTVSGYVGCY